MQDQPLPSTPFIREIQLLPERIPIASAYPFNLAFAAHLDPLVIEKPVTFLIGENGSGKSTLLEAVATAWGFNAEGGSLHFNFSTRLSHSAEFADALRLVKGVVRPEDGYFLRAESFFNVATEIESLDQGGGGRKVIDFYGGRSLHEQSHGESFYALFNNRFRGNGLYLLDEPEAALSLSRQLSFLARIHELVAQNSQFIIATHSPILMAYPGAAIMELSDKGVRSVAYEDVEQVGIYRYFLNNPKRMLKDLLDGPVAGKQPPVPRQ